MKRIFQIKIDQDAASIWLLLLRICIGIFMLTHGFPKLEKFFSSDEIKFADPIGIGVTASLILSTFAEFLCSLLLIFGFATRFASISLIINMLVAVIFAHAGNPFKIRELALMYLIGYCTLLVLGAGKYSVDFFIDRKNNTEKRVQRRS